MSRHDPAAAIAPPSTPRELIRLIMGREIADLADLVRRLGLSPGDAAAAERLAVDVRLQCLASPVRAGTVLQSRTRPEHAAIVVGCKPAGYLETWQRHECARRMPMSGSRLAGPPLVWTVSPGRRPGISQSPLSDWIATGPCERASAAR